MVKRRPAAIRTEKRKSHPGRANATGRVPACEDGRARATGSGDVSRGGDSEGGRVRTCATHCEIASVIAGEVVVFFVGVVGVVSSSMAASARQMAAEAQVQQTFASGETVIWDSETVWGAILLTGCKWLPIVFS